MDGNFLSSRHMQASTHLSMTAVYDLLFADGCALNTAKGANVQRSTDLFEFGHANFGQNSGQSSTAIRQLDRRDRCCPPCVP
ncbi:hypothetical protein SprV_0100057700 [Sparganum proliferum]